MAADLARVLWMIPARATSVANTGWIAQAPRPSITSRYWVTRQHALLSVRNTTRQLSVLPKDGISRSSQPSRPASHIRSGCTRPIRRNFHESHSRRSQAQETKDGAQQGTKETEDTSIRARFRKLSREYGWAAVGVYAALSVLDFPFCFLLVRVVGTDRIADAEEFVMSRVKKVIPQGIKDWWHNYRVALKKAEADQLGNNDLSRDVEMVGWGVQEAEQKHKAEASLGTQLALAYAIHKSFIFARVPLTAAVTPKVVKTLRSWGWQIGKKTPKA